MTWRMRVYPGTFGGGSDLHFRGGIVLETLVHRTCVSDAASHTSQRHPLGQRCAHLSADKSMERATKRRAENVCLLQMCTLNLVQRQVLVKRHKPRPEHKRPVVCIASYRRDARRHARYPRARDVEHKERARVAKRRDRHDRTASAHAHAGEQVPRRRPPQAQQTLASRRAARRRDVALSPVKKIISLSKKIISLGG